LGLGAGPNKACKPENQVSESVWDGFVLVAAGLGVNDQLTHALAAGVEVSAYYGLIVGAANATVNLALLF
jgi:hypothetical protein